MFTHSYSFKLAVKYLFDKKQERWISISGLLSACGLFLGVTTLIIILSVMQGFRNTMLDKLLQIQGHINICGNIQEPYKKIKIIENEYPKVDYLIILEKQFMAMSNNQTFGVLMHGLNAAQLKSKLKGKIISGSIDNLKKPNYIAVGQTLAQEANLKLNDTFLLASAQSIDTPFGSTPKMEQVQVGAIFSLGFHQYDKLLCFMNIAQLQEFMEMPDTATNILLFVNNNQDLEEMKSKLKILMPIFNITNWQETNITFAQVLNIQRNVMFIVISLMIIIASFNGLSSLLMLVKEKTKDIAILKVLGAGNKQILLIFFYIGSIIGVISIVFGILFGVTISYNLDYIRQIIENTFQINLFPADFYHLEAVPVFLDFQQIIYIGLWCFLLSILSIIYPCLKALKIEPDRELRI